MGVGLMAGSNLPKLKSCPFCGGDAQAEISYDETFSFDAYKVECVVCEANIAGFTNKAQAVKAWNRRK